MHTPTLSRLAATLALSALLLLVASSSKAQSAAAEAVLSGIVIDAASAQPTPCTVTIVDAHGQVVIERESFKAGFRCPGKFEKRLPPGRTKVRVTRGFETRAVERDLDLKAGTETDIRVRLERTVDLRKRGWFAGDSHVHMIHGERTIPVDFDYVALAARAEDLQYLSLAQGWEMQNPTPERLEAELARRSTPDCVLTWNLEAPKNYYKGDAGRCLGHCWFVAMRGRTAEGQDAIGLLRDASAWDYESSKFSHANFESHQLIHAQGGAVFYSHPVRWWMGTWGGQGGYPIQAQMRVSNMAVELPLDTLIGPTYDGLDVITGGGELEANAKAFQLWALLLNHGYRPAATGSSDACFDRPGGAVPGRARTYTFLENGFSLPGVARAMAAGKTFVTTGPLLLVTMDGKPPGSSFAADGQSHVLQVEAWASGTDTDGRLRKLEVMRNGRAAQTLTVDVPVSQWRTNLPVVALPQTWWCVRLFGNDAQKHRAVSGAFFFDETGHLPSTPTPVQVHARIVEAGSSRPLDGNLVEVAYHGPLQRDGKKHAFVRGECRLTIPGTVRLRAEVPGYSPVTLSPFFDHPALLEMITHLEDVDLLNWGTFERARAMLANVPLTFSLESNRLQSDSITHE
jgi:hypothetical protein